MSKTKKVTKKTVKKPVDKAEEKEIKRVNAAKTKLNKKAVIKALISHQGVVTPALLEVGVGRTQYYNWLKEDKSFKRKVDSMGEIALDFVEKALFRQIGDDIPSSTQFYLKTKGKRRGFQEKLDITSNDQHINQHQDLSKLTSAEIETLISLKEKMGQEE